MIKTFLLKQLLIGSLLLISIGIKANNYTFCENFNHTYSKRNSNSTDYKSNFQYRNYCKGIEGMALDLSEHAMLRSPIIKSYDLKMDSLNSFSLSVWIKTLPNAEQGTPILSTKKEGKDNDRGITIGTQENGAWYVQLSDGKHSYEYKPTAKQQINDGNWHQIALTVERPKNEASFYLDGEQVAIYNIESLGGLDSKSPFVLGGENCHMEYGGEGQWTAFNGIIDQVKGANKCLSSHEIIAQYSLFSSFKQKTFDNIENLKILSWNIWHGGHEFGDHVGVKRVLDIIKQSRADVVCLIETYGSGPEIADALNYHLYLISSNLSILSKYPITETIKAFDSFRFGGVKLKITENKQIVVCDTWIHYLPDYLGDIEKGKNNPKDLIAGEWKTRASELKTILKKTQYLRDNCNKEPLFMMGDFNVGSDLDWTAKTKEIHKGLTVQWPTSKLMRDAGFKDSYREWFPDELQHPGFTWSPRHACNTKNLHLLDRIDFIYYQNDNTHVVNSQIIDYHPIQFPSDHAAMLSEFHIQWQP